MMPWHVTSVSLTGAEQICQPMSWKVPWNCANKSPKSIPIYDVYWADHFPVEKVFHRLLHNETVFAIHRRLQWDGLATVSLPIRVNLSQH